MRLTIRNSDGTHSQPMNTNWHDIFLKLAKYEDMEEDGKIKSDDASDYEKGRFEMFQMITSAYYGKQYYFLDDNGLVYSRFTCKSMTVEEAYTEFIDAICEW